MQITQKSFRLRLSKNALRLTAGLAAVLLLALTLVAPSLADDVTGSVTIDPGELTMLAVDGPAFGMIPLDGNNHAPTDSVNINVEDLRGTGAGWNLQITSTTFSAGEGKTLPTNALRITDVMTICAGQDCVAPSNNVSPPTVPADGTAPTAVPFFNAATDTGMGSFTVTPTFELTIPATVYEGTYNSTITLTVVSGP